MYNLFMKDRAKKRKRYITYSKIDLHSDSHHSFHLHLDDKSSWELLSKLSKEQWYRQTGSKAPKHVDKSFYKVIRFGQDKCT